MVSQINVQDAAEAMDKEVFTITDLLHKLIESGIVPAEGSKRYPQRSAIAHALQQLRAWKIVDRLPQGHHLNNQVFWYLTKKGNPHKEPSAICHRIQLQGANRTRQLLIKLYGRKIRISPGKDKYDEESYEGGPMR